MSRSKAEENPNIIKKAKGKPIYRQGQPVKQIAVIIQGAVDIFDSGLHLTANKGDVIAAPDAYLGTHMADYFAKEDSVLFALDVTDEPSLGVFLGANDAYRGILVFSMAHLYSQYHEYRNRLTMRLHGIHELMRTHYDGMGIPPEDPKVPKSVGMSVEEAFPMEDDDPDSMFFIESTQVYIEDVKAFYRVSEYMALFHVGKINALISEVRNDCIAMVGMLKKQFDYLTDERSGLFYREKDYAMQAADTGMLEMSAISRIHDTRDEIVSAYELLAELNAAERTLSVKALDDEVAEIIEYCARKGVGESGGEEEEDVNLTEELIGSLDTILEFSGLDAEEAREFKGVMDEFVQSKDKLALSDEMRKIKRKLQEGFFAIYEKCVREWIFDKKVPLPVRLFLYFGYMDERLISQDQLLDMVSCLKRTLNRPEDSLVYYMPEWLEAVYRGEKEPSRNAFEQDYPDYLRELKKQGELNEKQMKERLDDSNEKLHFEIENFFKQNNKVVNGQVTTYAPVLYRDIIFNGIRKSFLDRGTLEGVLFDIEKTDVSAFLREVTFRDMDLGIEREIVLKRVYPDIILSPVYGSSASMWQEIAGKRRSSPARFVFPVMEESEIEKLMIMLIGRLHWEYVRRDMGADWNNIQFKSLTSEYSDYLMYFRQNKDLSEELRMKVKQQIQKARNNFREVFVADFINWVSAESRGSMKLNKVARGILATYCPFSKALRDTLMSNALFEKASKRQVRHFGEEAHKWELKIKKRENHDEEVPQEFYDTYDYYTK